MTVRRAAAWVRGGLGSAVLAMMATAPVDAAAQTAAPFVAGALAADGLAIQVSCEGSTREAFVATTRDLENAYSRALGRAGRVPQRFFYVDDDGVRFALDRVGDDDPASERTVFAEGAFVYRVADNVGEGNPALRFSEHLKDGALLTIQRLDAQVDIRGAAAALAPMDAFCPF